MEGLEELNPQQIAEAVILGEDHWTESAKFQLAALMQTARQENSKNEGKNEKGL